ncbi:uncharacterized protein V1513DRAFT_425007 [Lipomyces chichibuensis]|uniref:uncharacterized protein n=1 Tax=Lipomyces chichibuensis TaxID=1546026 RepID=UPI0033431996
MVVGQSDSSTFKFDFSGINWSKDDPVSIVNAYREALKRQEQQKKRRLLESQIVTNGKRELGSVGSSATISPTIPSASGSNGVHDNISNGGNHTKNYIVNNSSHEIAQSRPPSNTDSQVSEKPRKRPATESPEEQRGGIKSSLDALWNSRSVVSGLSRLRTGRRNIRKYAPPSYFAQLRRPGDKIAAIAAAAYAGDNDQNKSTESSTASVTLPSKVPAQATSDCSSLFSNSTAGFSEVPTSNSKPLYVDSITQTDTALHDSVNDRKRRLDVSDITPERKKRPGFFSAVFEDSDEELKEIEVEEPLLKKRRLFVHDGVTLASNPAFYRTRLVLDGPDLHMSPRKSSGGESDIARRRLELEREEREQEQEEREERLKRERQEKEAELERQRKELEEERKRQELKQKELEEKERQLKAELLKKEQQLAKSSAHVSALAPAGDNGAKADFTLGASSVPAQPSRLQPSADAINLGTPSFAFGLSTSTPNDKTASVAPYRFSVSSGSGTDSAAATATTTIGGSKPDLGISTSTTSSRFQFGVKSSADISTLPFTSASGLPFASGSSAPAFTSSSTSVPSIAVSSQAASSAPSTAFAVGLTSAPSVATTFSSSSKLSGSTEVASTSASGTGSTPALTFSFGKTSTPSSASTTSSASSGPSLPAFAIGSNVAATSTPAPAFSQSVSSASTTQATGAPSFSFGSSTTSSAAMPFGGFLATSSSASLIPGISAPTTTLNSAPSFTFTAGSTNTANPAANLGSSGASAAAPTFGSTTARTAPTQSSTSLFNFASSTANPAAVFGFNTSTESSPAPVAANGMTSSTPNMFASPAPSGTPPPGRKLAPMRGRLRRR